MPRRIRPGISSFIVLDTFSIIIRTSYYYINNKINHFTSGSSFTKFREFFVVLFDKKTMF